MNESTEIKLTVEIPAGYQATGEFRPPRKGEYFLTSMYLASIAQSDFDRFDPKIILRQIREPKIGEVWVNKTREPYLVACGHTGFALQFVSLDGSEWWNTGLAKLTYAAASVGEWVATR